MDDDDFDIEWWYEGASWAVPSIEVDVAERDDPPRILGSDGEPLPRLVHKFGFQPRPVWE